MKAVYVFLMIVFFSQQLFAQRFSVDAFREDASDVAAIRFPKTDVNDDVCAIIKVRSNIDGIQFDSNLGITAVENKPDGVWLYISPGERALRFMRQGIITKDYNLPLRIESSKVYILELLATTGDIDDPEIETQWLVITSEPNGADVYINDEPAGKTPYQNELPVGVYRWRVSSSLYLPENGTVNLENGQGKRQQLNVKLNPNYGTLIIRSQPENGAEISLNGINLNQTTPATIERVPAGEHQITLTLDDYETTSENFEISAGQQLDLEADMRPTFAAVTISTDPPSEIIINDQRMGQGTWEGRLGAGVHTFEAILDKHQTARERRQVMAGEPLRLTLHPEPITGNLRIITIPIGATIRIGNTDHGTSPTTIRNLLIGDYEVELNHQGHATLRKQVNIKEGETTEVDAELPAGLEITINSEPSGAELYINGKRVGTTPYKSELSFGNHQLRIVNHSRTVEETVQIKQGGQQSFDFNVVDFICGEKKLLDERDGNEYETVRIGSQCWMKENLKWLPNVSPPSEGSETSAHYYVYGYEGSSVSAAKATSNYRTYGVLYNWAAALNACPTGWRLPSDTDWGVLTDHLGGSEVAGGKMKATGTAQWSSPNTEASNESGFSALPGGLRSLGGSFYRLGMSGLWWSSAEYSSALVWRWVMTHRNGPAARNYSNKSSGFSLRCVRVIG